MLLNHVRSLAVLALLVVVVCGSLLGKRALATDDRAVAGIISGTIFQDYNANGKRDTANNLNNNGSGQISAALEHGVAGVIVTAFIEGHAVAGGTLSGADGSYSLHVIGDGPFRLEFTDLPAGYFPGPAGADSQSNVRFVSSANASNVDFGVVLPSNHCQDNPTLVTPCYVGGGQQGASPVVVTFPYSAGSTRDSGGAPFDDFGQPAPGMLARENQVGTVWGLAAARSSKSLYASAFMKKHSGFGPSGTGAIYRIDPSGNFNVSLFANANALLAGSAGNDPHDLNDFDRDNGNATWDAVGKLSFGGIALNGAETRLYAMNLAERALYEFPTDAPVTTGNTRKQAVPLNLPGCPSADDVRPFAVHWNEGQLFVGLTCTAESTVTQAAPNGDASKLAAYVYTVDPATLAFSAQPVFQAALNYPRRCADSAQLGVGNCFSAAWRPWTKLYSNSGTEGRAIFPQPWLTDIAFDRGNLVLGVRDRSGDQFGTGTLDEPGSNVRFYGVAAGDTLRACGSLAGGWTLESNGRCGGQGSAPQNTGEGPGNGEFYFQDRYMPFNDENGKGAILQVPGFPELVVNSHDPIPIFDGDTLFDGGAIWMNNTTGARRKAYRVYNGTLSFDIFGKANGLGDLVALCDPAPLELGNRVWRDDNGDGVQGSNEPGIANVKVELFKNGIKVGETTTSALGTYYFNASNVPGGILPQMNYEVRIDKTQPGLATLGLTRPDNDASANGDLRDSDAVMFGNAAVISVTTGGPGANNHNYDAGFIVPPAIICPPNRTACAVAGGTAATVNYPALTVTGSNPAVTCNPASGASFLVGTTTVTCTATNTAGTASCSFTVRVNVAPGIVCSPDITATSPNLSAGAVVNYPPPAVTGTNPTATCTPASGSTFPVGVTTVTCTANNECSTASCSFKVTVNAPFKCDTLCYRSPAWWLLNLDRAPGGTVQIAGTNGNQYLNTSNQRALQLALQGNAFGVHLTPRQALNQEYVAAQLNVLSAGGGGSPVVYNSMWANLSCYGIAFAEVTLSNGVKLSPASMGKELYMQLNLAILQRREVDYAALTQILDLLNGNDPRGFCN